MNIYTVTDKNSALLYKIIRENAIPSMVNL